MLKACFCFDVVCSCGDASLQTCFCQVLVCFLCVDPDAAVSSSCSSSSPSLSGSSVPSSYCSSPSSSIPPLPHLHVHACLVPRLLLVVAVEGMSALAYVSMYLVRL